MSENAYQSFSRFLDRLDANQDPLSTSYPSARSVVDDVSSIIEPFLINPERHREHIRLLIESAVREGLLREFGPMLQMFRIPILRSVPPLRQVRAQLSGEKAKFRQKVAEKRVELLDNVEAATLELDILPILSLETHRDWKHQDLRLLQLETRTAIYPSVGMEIESISHRIEVRAPKEVQFCDLNPSTSMEAVGQTELSVDARGKFVNSNSSRTELGSTLSSGVAKATSKIQISDKREEEAELGSSRKLSRTEQLSRVISSAVRDRAIWELLRTPTQTLLGGNKFLATLLVPSHVTKLDITLELVGRIVAWGPVQRLETRVVTVPSDLRARSKDDPPSNAD